MTDMHAYKILSKLDYDAAVRTGATATALDLEDGYVHLSSQAQVGETLRLHYAGQRHVHLLEFECQALGDLRWEPSRGGDLFPHLYGALQIALARRKWVLNLGARGVPDLPEDL